MKNFDKDKYKAAIANIRNAAGQAAIAATVLRELKALDATEIDRGGATVSSAMCDLDDMRKAAETYKCEDCSVLLINHGPECDPAKLAQIKAEWETGCSAN